MDGERQREGVEWFGRVGGCGNFREGLRLKHGGGGNPGMRPGASRVGKKRNKNERRKYRKKEAKHLVNESVVQVIFSILDLFLSLSKHITSS
jgi:hypothetical protein